jgi:hypothetical protein
MEQTSARGLQIRNEEPGPVARPLDVFEILSARDRYFPGSGAEQIDGSNSVGKQDECDVFPIG